MVALFSLAGLLVLFLIWCVLDFLVSIRLWAGQHTASMYVKNWVKSAKWHRILLAALLTEAFVGGLLYLMLHWIAQVI
jgi:hypothetical protein